MGKRRNPVVLIATVAVALVVAATALGALAAAFSGYTVGQYVHDLALLVLGLGAVAFALNTGARWVTEEVATATRPPRPPPAAAE